jgi:hypothetical protein
MPEMCIALPLAGTPGITDPEAVAAIHPHLTCGNFVSSTACSTIETA